MIYTELTNKALHLAFAAHEGQKDKAGLPYILHPIHLAEQMDDKFTTLAALLHDVVEDTDWTLEDLEKEGFPKEVLDALSLLTHEDGVLYMDYVAALKDNPIAKAVKLADLNHNMDRSRFAGCSNPQAAEQFARWDKKYQQALEFLNMK